MGKTKLLTEETYRMVVEYYIYYYNHLRPHSSLGYLPPIAA
ncbi:MAG: integrase core domain-containing protein [Clostridia bacterium]|nr:integrase core domain-containing protein [Clostridia bacterium]